MTREKHTPEPWSIDETTGVVYGSDGFRLDASARNPVERAANRALRIAAPKLLAACKAVAVAVDPRDTVTHEILRAAIVGARGDRELMTPFEAIDWARRTARQTQRQIDTGASARSTLGEGISKSEGEGGLMTGYHRAVLSGRCAKGAERDGGRVIHLVPDREGSLPIRELALCDTHPGPLSGGWKRPWSQTDPVSCKRCLRLYNRRRMDQAVKAAER